RLDLRDVPWPREGATRLNNVAWSLLTGPEKDRRPDQALPLTLKAVELAPGDGMSRNTLGVAYFRAGRYREAVAVLEDNPNNAGFAAFDLYFLAMSYHKLGEPARARDCFERAARWHDEKAAGLPRNHCTELAAFRAEAETLLKAGR